MALTLEQIEEPTWDLDGQRLSPRVTLWRHRYEPRLLKCEVAGEGVSSDTAPFYLITGYSVRFPSLLDAADTLAVLDGMERSELEADRQASIDVTATGPEPIGPREA